MQTCPNCSFENRPGVIFCENCGASLIGSSPIGTKNIEPKGTGELPADLQVTETSAIARAVQSASTDNFAAGTSLKIEITGAEPLVIKPKVETVFGRRDPATGATPDIDLTPFAGYRMGVSRRHALIKQRSDQKLELYDLGSSNGTFVNGTRLNAHMPAVLRDGDEIRLGQIVMRIFFQPGQPSESKPATQG